MLRIFVPAYNEEKMIVQNMLQLHRLLAAGFNAFQLYLVDDGSTDQTQVLARKLRLTNFQYVRCDGPSRRENLVQMMVKYSHPGDVIGFVDADRSTGEKALQGAVRAVQEGYDIVIGSRYVPGSKLQRKTDRLVISKLFNAFVRMYFRSRIHDHECGFKFFRAEVLKEVVAEMGINYERKMFWDSEMLVRAQRKELRILEIPVTWVEGPKSALSLWSELPMVHYMLALRFHLPK